ncbi:MAG: excinuclease ABC subunit A [Parcubacteria group bacterium RIFCSPHIGHO2_01_FULL_45_26]|nr:MAG: excinuclease ABC subunit A [Parcubacteria group bacterium RIFCSPHIGHO2_01_FULL_45_26]
MTSKEGKNQNWIKVRGARTHNLKNIDVDIPRGKMTVVTGLSGSGKSSLAFDTIFAEGQRRYMESLSSYARQFIRQMQKPDVDEIEGLSPAISIDQKSRSNNPRSTVATITEIYDYLRVLFARIGRPHCLECGEEIEKLSPQEIVTLILKRSLGSLASKLVGDRLSVYAPMVRGRKGEYYQLLYDLLGKGYSTVRVDGRDMKLREQIILDKNKKHTIDVLIDVFEVTQLRKGTKDVIARLSESVERAIHEASGVVTVSLTRRRGLGGPETSPSDTDFTMSAKFSCPRDGFSFPEIEPRLFSFNSPYGACPTCHGLGTKHMFGDDPCEECKGARLRKEALAVLIGKKNIVEVSALAIRDGMEFFSNLKLTGRERNISVVVTKEIEARLKFMFDVGLGYLALDRRANTLSGGEGQRIRLASQLGSRLTGTLYVLDEPTIGLHARDNDLLVKTLHELRDLGNTILVVEHDEDTIYSSDYLVDVGPGAGIHGGEVVVADWTEHLLTVRNNSFNSMTVDYLRGERRVDVPDEYRTQDKGKVKVTGGSIFNIKNLNIEVPLGKLVCLTGVSGSGKSSFLYEILHKNLQARFDRKYRSARVFNVESFAGTEYLGRSILIDQSPIGRTPRSNPATYTGAWTHIRDIFAETEEARFRGWGPGRFSFNVKGGRCETCDGNGEIAVEMHFLPTVYVPCDVCGGKRFDKETLSVDYKKKNIHEVLKMTVEEAKKFFQDIPAISDRLNTLDEVGLGYLELGQSATTLSGGEAQRVKISSELYRPLTTKTIYLLDEPTVGLHYEDVSKLIEILQKLVNKGNTVVVIEHNMDVIKNADWIIDMGPEGGEAGGQIVAQGTPLDISNLPSTHPSYTAKYLHKSLKK